MDILDSSTYGSGRHWIGRNRESMHLDVSKRNQTMPRQNKKACTRTQWHGIGRTRPSRSSGYGTPPGFELRSNHKSIRQTSLTYLAKEQRATRTVAEARIGLDIHNLTAFRSYFEKDYAA